MNRADAKKAILALWITTWHTKAGGSQAAPTVPYGIDNRRIQQPATPPFAVVQITNLDSDQVTVGRPGFRRFERPGWIDVRLYGPAGQGTGSTDTLAEYVKEIFESRRIAGDITTYAASVSELRGDKEYPDLWCVLVRIPFWFHERR